ncbi:rho GTPase-activating protein SYDE2 isoform X1 [Conger conger]|uniref:rho GTPase-activating protein SYDE2 isoform X1 n=1 Tax=Conger conger TaxID=82655 RepID=UPI002A5AD408|nr:rho GTPase-activating protein SYDE2 isoform X1 [Conger conger]
MADPLRRTLLAKLRGKKSKKGTTAGGCGVAANGGREGKDKVLQKQAEQTQQAIIIAELNFVPDTLKGSDSCFIRRFDNGDIGFVHEKTVVENTFPQCEASMHINTRRWDIQCSEELGLRGRVNEELLGVSVQRETQERGSDSDEMSSFNKQELNFTRQVRPGSCGRSQGQKKHPVPIPRQLSGGDSIGFGMCENRVLKCRMVCTDTGTRKFADGQYPVSKNSGTNVGCKKDLKTHCDETDFCFQSEDNLQFMETLRDLKDTSVRTDHSQACETNAISKGTQMYQFGGPYHKTNADNVEEHILIRNIESYGNASEHQRDYKVSNLQSPTFFPTELEICDVNVASRYVGFREGAQRHNSLDSEDDDYYDNEILPFYETDYQNLDMNDGKASDHVDIANSEGPDRPTHDTFKMGINDSALETDRLRTQLKEAYYLLINAMHDISFDSQVSVNGNVDKASTSSHSQDSVCSQSSAKAIDTDAWSSGENSPQQVSDNDAGPQNTSKNRELCAQNFLISRSFENLSDTKIMPVLQRSVSDGAIKYPKVHPPGLKCLGSRICFVGKNCNEFNNLAGSQEKRLEYDGVSSDDLLPDNGDDGLLNESSGSVNSLTGSSDNAETQGNKQDFSGAMAVSARPQGVTVNKMQEWMHKGRMLSSEMKQRITGSSLRAHGPSSLRSGHGVSNRTKAATQMTRVQGSKSVAPCLGAQQSALIENVNSSIAAARELRVGIYSESRPPLNTITVSKKRNWLQQSSGKDGLVAMGEAEDQGPTANFPSEVRRPAPPAAPAGHCKPLRLHLSHITVTHARAVDPAEENDADDEGEIWYNPIPEDEEPEPGPRGVAVRLQVPSASEHAVPRRKTSSGDCGWAPGVSPADWEGVGECQGSPGNEASHANTTHSTEPAQLHRQMFACKPADENSAPKASASDGTELSNPGFSPPSSPNPLKKGSAINWSFPDKIKSPRTVRKLSMKMKKLPELSRKLSVKGTPNISQPEPRPSSPKCHGGAEAGPGPARLSPGGSQTAASRNVISRYHLDSSVSTQQSYSKKSNSGGSKSASKGGYLSDGDSPELVAKSGKHGSESKAGKSKDSPANCSPKLHGTELDIDAFRHYSFMDQPKCAQYISGLMSLHFYGAEDLKPPRMDSRDVYCAIQVDSVNKARTALLTCRTTFLDMDHTFNIELENAQHLKLVVFSWEPTPRKNRVCCHGTVVLPTLFRVTKTHQLAVKLEPRGMIYVKLNLMDQWQNSLDGPDMERDPQVFGVEAWRVVEREGAGLMVPLLIEKCITEIEKRGCQVVGLYRLCGSAAVKKELREAFERDTRDVELSENQYPDINVITGVLKDYLRELPSPLITKQLYEAVLDSMAKRPLRIGPKGCENEPADSELTVCLLEILPEVEKVTLRKLLDHLKLVASHHDVNKMTCQNLAVCFGPVLLSQRQEASCHSNRVFIDSEELASALHFKKHIEVLHYLLQLWPVVDPHSKWRELPAETSAAPQYLRRRRERPQVLNLSEAEMAGVLRPKPGRLDSPSNRYAGDWSCCGESYFQPLQESKEADYDDVPSEDTESAEEGPEKEEPEPPTAEENDGSEEVEEEMEDSEQPEESTHHFFSSQEHLAKEHTYQAYMKIQEISPVLSNRVNLKDLQESIDTLIGNLERELNKNKFNVGY